VIPDHLPFGHMTPLTVSGALLGFAITKDIGGALHQLRLPLHDLVGVYLKPLSKFCDSQ